VHMALPNIREMRPVSLNSMAKGFLKGTSWPEKFGRLLSIIAIILIVYLVILILTTPFYIRRIQDVASERNLGPAQVLPELKDIASYQEVINSHSVFGIVKQKAAAPARSLCDEFKSKYSLTGIVTGSENEALFNSKAGKQTYFAKAGEVIEGVTVKNVDSHSVMLDCSGQQIEVTIEETL